VKRRSYLQYPVDMPWENLIWILRPGDRLISPTGELYMVTKTTLLPLPGQLPIVELRKNDGNSHPEGADAPNLSTGTPPGNSV